MKLGRTDRFLIHQSDTHQVYTKGRTDFRGLLLL